MLSQASHTSRWVSFCARGVQSWRLSHHNVLSNIEGIREVFAIQSSDRFLGVLPFVHSFGFTVTLWLPLEKITVAMESGVSP